MKIELGAIVLDCSDPDRLAEFYTQLLGWEKIRYDKEWVYAKSSQGEGLPLVFQKVEGYQSPTWPMQAGKQQQMQHLDFYVENVDEAVDYALSCGARLNPVQLEEDWKVLLDPEGHPFCILPNKPPEH